MAQQLQQRAQQDQQDEQETTSPKPPTSEEEQQQKEQSSQMQTIQSILLQQIIQQQLQQQQGLDQHGLNLQQLQLLIAQQLSAQDSASKQSSVQQLLTTLQQLQQLSQKHGVQLIQTQAEDDESTQAVTSQGNISISTVFADPSMTSQGGSENDAVELSLAATDQSQDEVTAATEESVYTSNIDGLPENLLNTQATPNVSCIANDVVIIVARSHRYKVSRCGQAVEGTVTTLGQRTPAILPCSSFPQRKTKHSQPTCYPVMSSNIIYDP